MHNLHQLQWKNYQKQGLHINYRTIMNDTVTRAKKKKRHIVRHRATLAIAANEKEK